jgi:AcrR family transcriptional regulator
MGTRELQKSVRRRAILDAARALIQAGKSKDFSMPSLAEKAGVSLVTPYNLFGSKSNILLEIARADIFERADAIEVLPTDDLVEWVSEVSRTLAQVYYRNRHFYRRLIITLVAQESAAGLRETLELGYRAFEGPLARLQDQGRLLRAIPASILARHVSHSVTGSLQHCLMERGSEDRLRREIEMGLLILAAGACDAADRAPLLKRAEELQPIGS